MTLTPMAEGGVWLHSPFEPGNIIYLAPKQYGGHFKRLIGDGWMPVSDPRREEDRPQIVAAPVPVATPTEIALRVEIDELKALVQMLIAQKSEQPNVSTPIDDTTHSENPNTDSRSKRTK